MDLLIWRIEKKLRFMIWQQIDLVISVCCSPVNLFKSRKKSLKTTFKL